MLEVQNVTKKYGKLVAANDVSFEVPTGKIGVLLGPNGAGKSTVIKCIAGLVKFTGGVGICGMPSYTIDAKKVFAYVPEIPALFEALTVREHIDYIVKAYKAEVTEEEINSLLERFELLDKQDKLGNELSKGMMQKVSLCCALVIKPKVILLDEPMVGLDPAAIKELKNVVLELKEQNVSVLISTHMLEMVKELWDIVYVMDKGSIIKTYNVDEVEDKDIESLFFEATSYSEESDEDNESVGGEE